MIVVQWQKIKRLLWGKGMKRFFHVVLILFFLFEFYLFTRLYLFVSCVIPTYSMDPAIKAGDYIYVSQLIPGCRSLSEDKDDPGLLTAGRLAGLRPVRRNDVVVFNFPYAENPERMVLSLKEFYCKRCVALPGDTFSIDGEGVYRVKNCLDTLGNYRAQRAFGARPGTPAAGFRPVYLPRAGDELAIDSVNYAQYRKCIEYETRKNIRLREGTVYLDGEPISRYRFRSNYYFMAGDNVADSYDSRFWGILPEDFIVGVARFIWFSRDPSNRQIRWNRMFTGL